MALDALPGVIVTFGRDEIKRRFLRDYAIRAPAGTQTGPGTQPDIDASVFADAVQALYSDAVTIGNQTVLDSATGAFLDQLAAAEGVMRTPAQGAKGYVLCTVSAAGGTVIAGDTLKEPLSGLNFQVVSNKAIFPTDNVVQIVGIDTGPNTNLLAGRTLTFTNPRPGVGPVCTVDSSGLTGGSLAETDQQLINRIKLLKTNRPASGNDSDYQTTVQATPGVNVEKAFTYPAIMGPGTIGVVFTVRAQTVGGSRRPTASQIATVQSYLAGKMPATDGIFVGSLQPLPNTLQLRISWAPGTIWSDPAPWPPSSYNLVASTVTDPFTFSIAVLSGTYTGMTPPAVGNNLAFWNVGTQQFVPKQIATVTGTGPWFVTCNQALNTSDASYFPVPGQSFGPYSLSLNDLVVPIQTYYASLGPGEQVTTFYDPGIRQKRSPPDPLVWPKDVSNRILPSLLAVPSVQDAAVLNLASLVCPVGVPGTFSTLIELFSVTAYAS